MPTRNLPELITCIEDYLSVFARYSADPFLRSLGEKVIMIGYYEELVKSAPVCDLCESLCGQQVQRRHLKTFKLWMLSISFLQYRKMPHCCLVMDKSYCDLMPDSLCKFM